MNDQHVTKIDQDLIAMLWVPRCTCGWVGAATINLQHARKTARIHRMCKSVQG